jgi:hypothetical protein
LRGQLAVIPMLPGLFRARRRVQVARRVPVAALERRLLNVG